MVTDPLPCRYYISTAWPKKSEASLSLDRFFLSRSGWFQIFFVFTPIWGDDPISRANIFQMGWWKPPSGRFIDTFLKLGVWCLTFMKTGSPWAFHSGSFVSWGCCLAFHTNETFSISRSKLTPRVINGWNLKITHLQRENHLPTPPLLCSMLIFRGV